MNKRLPGTLSIAFIVCAVLFILAPNALLAQQSRDADSVKASSKDRIERGRSTSRDVQSRRPRGAARAAPSARPSDVTKPGDATRSARSGDAGRTRSSSRSRIPIGGETDADNSRNPSERAGTRRDHRDQNGGAATRGRNENSDRGHEGVRGDRGDNRRGDRGDNRRGDRDDDRRGDRGDDRRGVRDYDGRGDRDYDGRGDRDYERRDDRHRRRGQGIGDRHHGGKNWARSRIHIDIGWPWVHRHQRRWSPRYRYRQVVYVDAGWGRSRRESRLDLRTFYRHRVRDATSRRAVVDIEIDRIEIYEDGFFIGEVRRIPRELARMRAVVDRRHGVRFDRDVFLLGDPYVGFEIISTRHYDGFVLNKYRASHGIRVGVLDLSRERVVPVRRSRFFDPRDFSGFVPLNLLPEDAGWLVDYGFDSYSGHYWSDDDRYYFGLSDLDDYSRIDEDRATYSKSDPRGSMTGREPVSSRVTPERQALERSADRTFETDAGAKIRLKRASSIERVD